jgi:hypothetical protein
MKQQFLVIDLIDTPNYYTVENLESLISDMYECELETNSLEQVTEWFYNNHKVFQITGDIKELN